MGRALLARPRVLVMNEPSMRLSPQYVDRIFAILQSLNRGGIGILRGVEAQAAYSEGSGCGGALNPPPRPPRLNGWRR
jgi:ABC-type branched-subunit amino acid transport system ATPase component